MRTVTIPVTVDADGTATALSPGKVTGQIVGWFIEVGGVGDTSDWTVSTNESAQACGTTSNVTANIVVLETTLTLSAVCYDEKIEVVIAQGTASGNGAIHVLLQDEYTIYA